MAAAVVYFGHARIVHLSIMISGKRRDQYCHGKRINSSTSTNWNGAMANSLPREHLEDDPKVCRYARVLREANVVAVSGRDLALVMFLKGCYKSTRRRDELALHNIQAMTKLL
ncbi:hypothetical protein MTO96_014479 [Rhipicephalus appendiculatus]